MTTCGTLLLGIISLLQMQARPLILDTTMIGQERTFVVRTIRIDSNFPANCDTIESCTVSFLRTVNCDLSEGLRRYPDDRGVLLSPCYDVTWPTSFGKVDTLQLFETENGLYITSVRLFWDSTLLLPRTITVGQTWNKGSSRAWIAATDSMMIDEQLHMLVGVEAQVDMMPDKYVWAVGYGLLYYATLGTTPDGLFHFEYIDKKHINAILQHPIVRWRMILR